MFKKEFDNLESRGNYLNGYRQGVWKFFDPKNGHLRVKGNYKNGEKVGEWKKWGNDDELHSKGVYVNGVYKPTIIPF